MYLTDFKFTVGTCDICVGYYGSLGVDCLFPVKCVLIIGGLVDHRVKFINDATRFTTVITIPKDLSVGSDSVIHLGSEWPDRYTLIKSIPAGSIIGGDKGQSKYDFFEHVGMYGRVKPPLLKAS